MDYEMIMKLIDRVSDSSVTSLELEEENLKIKIKKNVQTVVAAPPQVMPAMTAQVQIPQAQPVVIEQPAAPAAQPAPAAEEDAKYITSPIVGVFYAAPRPDAEPYVKVGDAVKKGQIVGIVEAMKLMNEIESEVDGVITEILVNNQDGVEFGEPLFKVV